MTAKPEVDPMLTFVCPEVEPDVWPEIATVLIVVVPETDRLSDA